MANCSGLDEGCICKTTLVVDRPSARKLTPSHTQSFCCDKDCDDQSENFQKKEFDI